MNRHRTAAAALVLLALSVGGCSAGASTPEGPSTPEDEFLAVAGEATESAGFGWNDETQQGALEYGNDVCASWDEGVPAENTREQNVMGDQATARLSSDDEATGDLLAEYVAIASDYLCPEE